MIFKLPLKALSPPMGKAFGLLLFAAVVAIIWYGSARIDSLKIENQQLENQQDVLDTQMLEMEQRYDEQQQAISLVLQSQVSIRQSIANQKSQIKKQTGRRKHAAQDNPDALGTAVTDSLADIMQQFQATTRGNKASGSNGTATPYPN